MLSVNCSPDGRKELRTRNEDRCVVRHSERACELTQESWAWEEASFLILVFGASLGLESSSGI